MKKLNFKRFLSGAMALALSVGMMATAASAAPLAEATIDMSKKGSLEIYKYDLTNAEKDGVWNSSYISTGVKDQSGVNDILGGATRRGDDDTITNHQGGQTSNGYAIAGVEFSYLKVADIVQFTESALDGKTHDHVEVLYAVPQATGLDMLTAIGLTAEDRYLKADDSDKPGFDSATYWYFQSNTLINAMKAALADNATNVKNALETYMAAQPAVKMAPTDADGHTSATQLDLGLYLVVETKVPEMVISTTNPFFVSLPMTSVNGTNAVDGGTRWIYDVCLYPKNLTGIPTLEKTLRESKADTGKNGATATITDGFAHTGTASMGDVIEYQIISTLPTITSASTYLTQYGFVDTLSAGMTYTKGDVVLEFFRDKSCTKKLASWAESDLDPKFTVSYNETTGDAESVMTIAMTAAGLKEINTNKTVYNTPNSVNAGYSDCTLRITYTAKLDSDHSTIIGDNGNPNEVIMTWKRSNSEFFDTLHDDAHIYTYGVDLTKQFAGEAVDTTEAQEKVAAMFDSVEFLLQNKTDGYFVTADLNPEEGVYYVTGHQALEENATHFKPVTTGTMANYSHNNGRLVIKGLEDDQYILTEVQTANGYTLLKENIDVTITTAETLENCDVYTRMTAEDTVGLIQNDPRYAEQLVSTEQLHRDPHLENYMHNMPQKHLDHKLLTASATVDGNAVTMLADRGSEKAEAPLTVVNTPGFDLPGTGDTAARILPILGGICAASAVAGLCISIYYLFGRKRSDEQDSNR